ncbi:helix-turn-helix transcriptional regulator [Altererythrobacter sp. ZODW24]|uniref:helix-turn-helix transcriptional regulator n=1 Tax=Altererythrobacter sp. ZODW24 TaxID=2185142 RepID=UPI0013B45FF1|nr:helix-turn-helix transcriptional regulator [Altererythrobacter sp. ZODW24]
MDISKGGVAAAKGQLFGFKAGFSQRDDFEAPFEEEGLSRLFDALAMLDQRKRMLVRRDGTCLVGCSRFEEVLNRGDCLRLTGGTICAARSIYNAGLQKLLAVQAPNVLTLVLPCDRGSGHLLMRATALNGLAVCLSLHHAVETDEPELPDLEDVFHLTKTEAMVVHALFLGHTPQTIARNHDNSIHTVRAHIRRCYDKLHISCREELWSRLNAYRLY